MSYEGNRQYWCPDGHYWFGPGEVYNVGDNDHICFACKQEAAVTHDVDDTNCDNWGYVEPVEVSPGNWETCNLGHKHETEGPTYEIPTIEQLRYAQKHGSWPPKE